MLQILGYGVAPLHYLLVSIGKRVSDLGAPCLFFGFGIRFRLFGVVYGATSGFCYRVWHCQLMIPRLDPGIWILYCCSAALRIAYAV